MEQERENVVGTIEHTRKMLAFLETLDGPSEAAKDLIRRYRAEVAAHDYGLEPPPSSFYAARREQMDATGDAD